MGNYLVWSVSVVMVVLSVGGHELVVVLLIGEYVEYLFPSCHLCILGLN